MLQAMLAKPLSLLRLFGLVVYWLRYRWAGGWADKSLWQRYR